MIPEKERPGRWARAFGYLNLAGTSRQSPDDQTRRTDQESDLWTG
jgi:hypothetical protein